MLGAGKKDVVGAEFIALVSSTSVNFSRIERLIAVRSGRDEGFAAIDEAKKTPTGARPLTDLENSLVRVSQLMVNFKEKLAAGKVDLTELFTFRKPEWETIHPKVLALSSMGQDMLKWNEVFSYMTAKPKIYWQWKMVENYFFLNSTRSQTLSELMDQIEKFFGLSRDVVVKSDAKPVRSITDEDEKDHVKAKAPVTRKKAASIDGSLQVIFIGDYRSGKTSLIQRYLDNKFVPVDATVGVGSRGGPNKSRFYDSGGQSEFRSLLDSYFVKVNCVVVVYDVTSKKSFENVKDWISLSRKASSDMRVILVGNKVDIEKREVFTSQGEDLAESMGLDYIETSAKTGSNVKELFELIQKKPKREESPAALSSTAELGDSKSSDKLVRTATSTKEDKLPLGFIEKRGYWATAYKARWFVLNRSLELVYFEGPTATEEKGKIPLKDSTISRSAIENSWDADYIDRERCVVVKTKDREYRVRAEDEEAAENWSALLKNASSLAF